MAKDDRLDQIKEGAGLEESRINQDLVDFLRKWSSPVLLVLAALSLGWFFWNKQKEARLARIDEAFMQFNQSTSGGSPSPDALKRIAADYDDVEGVHILATLAAADEYLRAVRRGVTPGAELTATGEPLNMDDMLDDAEKTRFLQEAETLYRHVFDETDGRPAMSLHTLSALYGLAATAESTGDTDRLKNVLDQAKALAEKSSYLEHRAITTARLENVALFAEPVELYDKADLPEIPALAPPEAELPEVDESDLVGPQQPEDGIGALPGGDGAVNDEGDDDAADAEAGESGEDDGAG